MQFARGATKGERYQVIASKELTKLGKNKTVELLITMLLGLSMVPVAIHPAQATIAPAADYVVTNFATGFPSSTSLCNFNGKGCGPIGLAFDASGNLFVTDINNGGLYKFPPAGGDALAHLVNTILGNPTGLVFTKNGELMTSRAADDDIVELNLPSGVVGQTIAKLPTSTFEGFGLAIDPLSGDLFASSSAGGPIFRISIVTSPPGTVTMYSNIPQADGIGFDTTNGVLYAASNACGGGGGGVANIAGTNSPTPGMYKCLPISVPTADGLAISLKHGAPILFVNRSDGTITEVDYPESPAPGVTDIPIPGGTRGDFATVGPDGCLYATQTNSVIKVTNADGRCRLGGFHNLSENLSSCLAPCSSEPRTATVGSDVDAVWLNNTSGNANILFSASHNNGSSFGPVVKITNSTTGNAANEQVAMCILSGSRMFP